MVLHRSNPSDQRNIQDSPEGINVGPPSKGDTVAAIKEPTNEKASGRDEMYAELFKTEPELAARFHLTLFVIRPFPIIGAKV